MSLAGSVLMLVIVKLPRWEVEALIRLKVELSLAVLPIPEDFMTYLRTNPSSARTSHTVVNMQLVAERDEWEGARN